MYIVHGYVFRFCVTWCDCCCDSFFMSIRWRSDMPVFVYFSKYICVFMVHLHLGFVFGVVLRVSFCGGLMKDWCALPQAWRPLTTGEEGALYLCIWIYTKHSESCAFGGIHTVYVRKTKHTYTQKDSYDIFKTREWGLAFYGVKRSSMESL